MHRPSLPAALAASLAALFAGCEWTGTSSADSWSGSYDAMNFSGTYRSVSTLTGGTETTEDSTQSVKETVGSYQAGTYRYAGTLSHAPVVLDSVQIQLGGITYTGDGSGNLVSDYGSGKVTSAGAWSVDVTGSSETTTEGTTTVHAQPVSGEKVGTISTSTTTTSEEYWDYNGNHYGSKAEACNAYRQTTNTTYSDDWIVSHGEVTHHAAVTSTANSGTFVGKLAHVPIVEKTLVVSVGNLTFTDTDGTGTLKSSASGAQGTVSYAGGTISLDWSGNSQYLAYSGSVTASYSYNSSVTTPGTTTKTDSPLTGSGSIVAVYSYSLNGSASASAAVATSSSDITAITVSQSGQNLSMRTNTGVTLTGRFTAVRQTGNTETANGATATYNAQFQVSDGSGHKMVGSLNYDLARGYRMLNGTFTSGSATYDVQGVGPAFSATATN